MNRYIYSGPVLRFNTCIDNNWKCETYAVSEKKARSNLAYRYKQQAGLVARTDIKLPGKLIMEEQ